MTDNQQNKPLTPSGYQPRSDEERDLSWTKLKQRRCVLKCCGCCTTGILFLAVLVIILVLTVFRVKGPEITMKRFTILQLSPTSTVPSTLNIHISVAVKNPNVASFRYNNITTLLYYHGTVVGEGYTPAGIAKARRTQNMNLSIEINTSRVLAHPNFLKDIGTGVLTVDSYTSLRGRVNIINIIKKHLVVRMNCTVTANVTSQGILDQKCKRKVSF